MELLTNPSVVHENTERFFDTYAIDSLLLRLAFYSINSKTHFLTSARTTLEIDFRNSPTYGGICGLGWRNVYNQFIHY